MKQVVFAAVFVASIILCACALQGNHEAVHEEKVDLVEFEVTRNLLYDSAMTICTGLAECDGFAPVTDMEVECVEVFKTHRVPSLEVLLCILECVDDNGSIYDVYDDDEGAVDTYYTMRERYEAFFN